MPRRAPLLAFLALGALGAFVAPRLPLPSPTRGARHTTRFAAPAPVKPRPEAPQMPSSPDPRRMGEAVRWLMDEDVEKPPEWLVLLLDKTFQTRKNTVYRVTSSLMSELPELTLAEARSKAEHARDHFFSVLSTTPEWNKAIRLAQSLQRLGLAVRVVPGFDRDAFLKGNV